MKRLCLLLILLSMTASAGAQRINLRISQRADGGQTIGVGGASQQQPRQQQQGIRVPSTDPGREIARIARAVLDQIASHGWLTPSLATGTLQRLADPVLSRAGASPRHRVLYSRTITYAAAVTGDLSTARTTADQWRQAAPTDAAAIRNQLMVALLAGDAEAARAAIAALGDARHARWLPWTTYMRNFLPLVGAVPEVEFTAANGVEFRLADHRGKVVVLCFWAADDQPARKLAETFRGPVFVVRSVRLGADNGSAADAAKALGLSAAPTAYVFGRDGRVVFAGDPRTWEVHAAMECARVAPSVAKTAPAAEMPVRGSPGDAEKARALRDQGWDKIRLWGKTRSPMYRKQGEDLLNQVIREYPNTRSAIEARQILDNLAQ